jgi:hypothetical protein
MKYIGQRKFGKREPYLGSGKIIKQAIKKYGIKNFSKQILCRCRTKETLDKKEIYYIKLYNAVESDEYYNISIGGSAPFAGLKHTEKWKEEQSKVMSGENHWNYGNQTPKKTRKKISASEKGQPKSKKHRENIAKAKKGKKRKPFSDEWKNNISLSLRGEKNPNFGKHLSKKQKNNLRLAHLGQHPSDKTRKKISDANSGENNPMFGKQHSKKSRKRMSLAQKERRKREKQLREKSKIIDNRAHND